VTGLKTKDVEKVNSVITQVVLTMDAGERTNKMDLERLITSLVIVIKDRGKMD
jgi:hypothetical protein